MHSDFIPQGRLQLGCNYWASHAGTAMWRDWRPEQVERDFAALAAEGVTLMRVFPLWPDFQPIHLLRAGHGRPVEVRHGDHPLPDTAAGQAGLDETMLERFAWMCDAAQRHSLRLIVGLLTGWMSGRLFVPPALEGLNPITDPFALMWQRRFVHGFATHLRDKPAIVAWDLGNECNVLGPATNRAQAYVWTSVVSDAIRSADASRPVVSGMHTLYAPTDRVSDPWLIDDQAELTDVLTTHPYPYWVRHARIDAVDHFRTSHHATAETRLYADLGGKVCIAEEIGTMGPMVAGDEATAAFTRINLFSLWANDARAFLWWCAHDQAHLAHPPYDWNAIEQELGLFRGDGTPRPALREMRAFRDFVAALPFSELPPPAREAVCVLTHGQDNWGAAYAAHVLAKQARIELRFRHAEQSLPEAPAYLLPAISGPTAIPRRVWNDLLDRVRRGAVLYVSLADAVLPAFTETAGMELLSRAPRATPGEMRLGQTRLPLLRGDEMRFRSSGAQVLASDERSEPVFWSHACGRGRIFVCTAPIETQLADTPRAFEGADAPPFWRLYAAVADAAGRKRAVVLEDTRVALTEHDLLGGKRVVVAVNHSAETIKAKPRLASGWKLEADYRSAAVATDALPPGAAIVLVLRPDAT